MEKEKYIYKAFISYTARDDQFVNKLEEWLYHLSEHADADQKYKFFRDKSYSEAGANVEDELKQKLKESEWLILVCSPYINEYRDSEKNWVDFECSYYAYTLGRKANIVCIISDTAPSGRDIRLFYPESIRDLHEKLAADMRGKRIWGEEASRIYAKITGRDFKDIYNIANAFFWEQQYYDIIPIAYKRNREGNNREALRLMSKVPDKYNPGKMEWHYLKALCSRSFYNNYCGCPDQPAGTRVICFDRKSSYAYSTDNRHFYIIDCLQAKVVAMVNAHDQNIFRFFYIAESYIATFDDQITVKLWKYDKDKITMINQTTMRIQFSRSEPEVFRSFYPDCQLNHMPAAYHHKSHLLALTARYDLFLLNMETMEYKTMDIPSLKKNMTQLSCIWKNIAFSENAEMLFLTDEIYLLGWNLSSGNCVFCWSRKYCHPSQYTCSGKNNIFEAENPTHKIYIYNNGLNAEWKENGDTILHFNTIPQKNLNSVYIPDKDGDHIILLYDGNTVQVLERNIGVVYSEDVSIENQKMVLDHPETYCPAVLWQGGLWHLTIRQPPLLLRDEKGNHLSGKKAAFSEITAVSDQSRTSIVIYNESGHLLAEKEICTKKQPKILTDEEMNFPSGKTASELLKKHICKNKDQEIFECSTYTFIDKNSLLIGCTKGYLYLWEIENDVLTKIDQVHKQEITVIQTYQRWNTVITTDREGSIAIWQYEKDYGRISLQFVSSICTYKKCILVQLLSEHELAVFCNDTGELTLYTGLTEDCRQVQTLLCIEDTDRNNAPVLSIYVTADRSRLIVCRKNQIDFIRLSDGKIILESEMHGEMQELRISDDEKEMELSIKDRSGYVFQETYCIASLTDAEFDRLLLDRRLHFFSHETR